MTPTQQISLLMLALTISGCDHPETARHKSVANPISHAVDHPQRPSKDIARDNQRNPARVLSFFNIKPGDHVLELLAAGGYYTELISRCVGNKGKVFMQNNQRFYEFQSDKSVIERLANNRLNNVQRWDHELTSLNLADNSIDKSLMILVLHDFYWMEKDVKQVLAQVFKVIKPGGILGIVDHLAIAGSGAKSALDMRGIHRIDKEFVIQTMLAQGFEFDGENKALLNPQDDLTKAFFSPALKGKPTSRFMLRFKKPEQVIGNVAQPYSNR